MREEDLSRRASYVLRDHQYFLDHTDYDATASSTLAAQGKHNYDVVNIKGDPTREVPSPWVEGVEGDGIGESITLNVKRPLPLYGILIQPGYYEYDDKEPWLKNNRVAALEIMLNDEHTFTESIPDERFERPYLIRVRDYTKPVNKIKLVIKGVHRGTQFRDTCISLVELRAPLSKKPEVHGGAMNARAARDLLCDAPGWRHAPQLSRPARLPIYIEDNHAGTFYWLAQKIDLDQSYTLILFDAHSDASGIFDSDKIRDALRNVASTQDRQTLLDRWRSKGAVQCFNWIEPLMPAPIEKVIWVPAEKLSASQIREHRRKGNGVARRPS